MEWKIEIFHKTKSLCVWIEKFSSFSGECLWMQGGDTSWKFLMDYNISSSRVVKIKDFRNFFNLGLKFFC